MNPKDIVKHGPIYGRLILVLSILVFGANVAFAEVTKNQFESAKELAEQGDRYAQFDLAVYYENGLGVKRNPIEAVKWWRKLAARGDDAALWSLGLFYESGEGVLKDYTEAYACYSVAGITQQCARASLRELESKLSPTQIAEGQRRGRELMKEIENNNQPTIGERISSVWDTIYLTVFKKYKTAWFSVIFMVGLIWAILTGRVFPKHK